MKYLIVGLGNPGKQYEKTRHNIGFSALDLIAQKYGLEFKNQLKMRGALAEGIILDQPCILLKPLTFMNLSGDSVNLVMRYHPIDLSRLLIVTDDVSIPFETMRLKINSGAGGHNGLKSIEESLQTTRYARLRLGVGDRTEGDLSSHVLGRFTPEELVAMSAFLEKAVEATEIFIKNGITRAMDFANRKT